MQLKLWRKLTNLALFVTQNDENQVELFSVVNLNCHSANKRSFENSSRSSFNKYFIEQILSPWSMENETVSLSTPLDLTSLVSRNFSRLHAAHPRESLFYATPPSLQSSLVLYRAWIFPAFFRLANSADSGNSPIIKNFRCLKLKIVLKSDLLEKNYCFQGILDWSETYVIFFTGTLTF